MKIVAMIWQLGLCGTADQLAKICKDYNIDGVSIKVLNGTNKWNVHDGDSGLKSYIERLRELGLIVEGWGYHYVEQASLQGEMIEERRQKLLLPAYQLNVEGEFKEYGAARAIEVMVSKVKTNRFELTICSYRFPTLHAEMPWDKMARQENIDGWTPQVYWALSNNPVEQLARCVQEYGAFSSKPVLPVGPTFGQTFQLRDGSTTYWMPTDEELIAFRTACKNVHNFPKIYYFRLDQVIQKGWWDMLKAATGVADIPPEPDPDPPEGGCTRTFTSLVHNQAVRSEPTISKGEATVLERMPIGSTLGPVLDIVIHNYREVWFEFSNGWMAAVHGGHQYLDDIR